MGLTGEPQRAGNRDVGVADFLSEPARWVEPFAKPIIS
jgi:hypothetical protein